MSHVPSLTQHRETQTHRLDTEPGFCDKLSGIAGKVVLTVLAIFAAAASFMLFTPIIGGAVTLTAFALTSYIWCCKSPSDGVGPSRTIAFHWLKPNTWFPEWARPLSNWSFLRIRPDRVRGYSFDGMQSIPGGHGRMTRQSMRVRPAALPRSFERSHDIRLGTSSNSTWSTQARSSGPPVRASSSVLRRPQGEGSVRSTHPQVRGQRGTHTVVSSRQR